jgi:hypothetical protein
MIGIVHDNGRPRWLIHPTEGVEFPKDSDVLLLSYEQFYEVGNSVSMALRWFWRW